jgi:hypothetical protein
MSRSSQHALAAELAALGYLDLFMRAGTEHQDRLWNRPDGPEELEALAVDPSASWGPRFLAAEILFRKQAGFPRNDQRDALAPAYVEALRHATMGNPWGLPGELDGDAGRHLVSLGEAAAVALEPLLDDERRVPYWGSQEATWGNSFAFRVKDFAAFFVSAIRGRPYVLHTDPSARDGDIQKLVRPPR